MKTKWCLAAAAPRTKQRVAHASAGVKKNAGKRKSKSNAYDDFRFIYTKARHGLGEVIRSTSEKFRQELKRDWTVVQRTPHLIRLRSAQAEQVNDRQPRGASPGVVGRPHRDRGAVTASASNRCFRPFSWLAAVS